MAYAQCASVHHQRAECLRDLGRDAEAIQAYRETFAEQRRRPSYITNAHLDFAWWIAVSGRRDLFDEAMSVLEEFSRAGGITFPRSEEHTSELQSLMRNSYAVFCLKKKNTHTYIHTMRNYKHSV